MKWFLLWVSISFGLIFVEAIWTQWRELRRQKRHPPTIPHWGTPFDRTTGT